jgi:hypothetical protein
VRLSSPIYHLPNFGTHLAGAREPLFLAPRSEELSRILSRIVDIGLRGGWAEFEDNPVPIPQGAHLQGSQHISRARSDASVIAETDSHSARSTSSSASPNLDAPIEQSSEQLVSDPHK